MGGWYLLAYSYSFNQLKIKILLTYFLSQDQTGHWDDSQIFIEAKMTLFGS